MATSLKASVGPWNNSSRKVLAPNWAIGTTSQVPERAVGLAREPRRIRLGDQEIADERTDRLDRHLGVGRPAKPAMVCGESPGQVSGA